MPDAQVNLGSMYDNGRGAPQNYSEAIKWYHRAAEQGHAVAQHNLGCMYKFGKGVPEDHAEAAKWFRKAAIQGYANSQFQLGLIYGVGEAVTLDYVQAYKWISLAATGSPTASETKNIAISLDALAAKMTTVQLTEAQRLVQKWKLNVPQDTPSEKKSFLRNRNIQNKCI